MEQQNKLYVGNFPFAWTEDDLEQVFNDFKDHITDIKIIYDQFSGRSKGFAFVTMDEDDAVKRALDSLADVDAGGRKLVISRARPPAERQSFDRGGGGRRGGGDRGDRGGRRNNSEY